MSVDKLKYQQKYMSYEHLSPKMPVEEIQRRNNHGTVKWHEMKYDYYNIWKLNWYHKPKIICGWFSFIGTILLLMCVIRTYSTNIWWVVCRCVCVCLLSVCVACIDARYYEQTRDTHKNQSFMEHRNKWYSVCCCSSYFLFPCLFECLFSILRWMLSYPLAILLLRW